MHLIAMAVPRPRPVLPGAGHPGRGFGRVPTAVGITPFPVAAIVVSD